MSWASRYIGIPYVDLGRDRRGLDCWGLARLVYAEEAQIDLPVYEQAHQTLMERAEVAELLGRGAASATWHQVTALRALDLIVFRVGRLDSHVGIALGRDGLMLHISRGGSSRIESWRAGYWQPRFSGAYRHRELVL